MKRLLTIVLSLGMLGILAAPVAAARPASNGLLTDVPVTGMLAAGGAFEGFLSITDVALGDEGLVVGGILNGVATDAAGIVTPITDLVFSTTATLTGDGVNQPRCDILFLDLGPLNLNVLGLVVDLSAIQLDVHAVPGAGNLLGNLLCAVAGLLDGPNPIGNALTNLLGLINRILG